MSVTIGGRAAFDVSGVRERSHYGGALLAYAIALPLLLLLPPYFKGETGLFPGFTWQEAVDLLTPVVILPLFTLALLRGGGADRRVVLAAATIGAIWVSGQAIHLATNATGDVADASGAPGSLASQSGELGHWLDEVLSHWIWHVGWVGLMLLLALSTWPSRRAGIGAMAGSALVPIVAGAVQGITWFIVTVEGVTAALGIPAAVVFALIGFLTRWAGGSARVTALFLLGTGLLALAGYAAWAAVNCGQLPEFTKWTGASACRAGP